jgi:diguanylate cyclase (GGDEF)-like protein
MDRWERRLHVAARTGAAEAESTVTRLRADGPSDPVAGVDREVAGSLHPDEVPIVRALLDLAGSRPALRAEMPLLVRDGDRWVSRDFEVCTELMGPVLRPAGGIPPRRRRTDADGMASLDRAGVIAELETALGRAGDRAVILLLVDLDRFKLHNDSLGDEAGNEILRTVGRRIAECAGRSYNASSGSDEFLVILEGMRELGDAASIAERIRRAIAEPVPVDGHDIVLTATIGVALGRADTPADRILRDATTAVFTGKDHGRDRVAVFDEQLEVHTARRVASTQALRRALEGNDLEMHYQPVVSLKSGRVIGAEALLRVASDDDGHRVVRPARLIDAAEDVGLIDRLGEFILTHTIAQLVAWEPLIGRDRPFRVSINVSPVQLASPGFTDRVRSVLRAANLDPSRLSLELTESIFLDPDPDVDAAVRELVELGVSFGLDDFGGDHSSWGGLRRFPVEFVKLDRGVVVDVDTDEVDRVIAGTAISLVSQLGFLAVAVGVERESQRDVLRDLGCDAAQGFLFDAPMTAEEFGALL